MRIVSSVRGALVRRVAVLGVVAVAIGACSKGTGATTFESPPDASPVPSTAAPSSTGEPTGSVLPSVTPSSENDPSTAVAWSAFPQVGDCYDTSAREVEAVFDTEEPIPCSDSHTSETYRVIDWPFDTSPLAMSQEDRYRVAEQGCLPLSNEAAGVMTYWAFYVPSPTQWDEGQRWLRCDGMVSLNESQTAFAQWTGSVVRGEVREVLRQEGQASPRAPKWKALANPPSNPTYVVLKRVVPQSDGSFMLTIDPLTPDFGTGPDDGCRTYSVREPKDGFFCLTNVTEKDRKVTLKPNAEIYYADSQLLEMPAFMSALETQPAIVALNLDAKNYAEAMIAVPM